MRESVLQALSVIHRERLFVMNKHSEAKGTHEQLRNSISVCAPNDIASDDASAISRAGSTKASIFQNIVKDKE